MLFITYNDMKHQIKPMHYSILYPEIREVIKNPNPKEREPNEIDRVIENYFNVSIEELRKYCRKRDERVLPRQMWMYLLDKHTPMKQKEIGKYTSRDRASVWHSVKKVNAILEFKYDPFHKKFKEVIASVEAI